VTHEFGNVLTGILGFAELALGQVPRDGVLRGYLQELHRAALAGALLTNQLRLFASRRPYPPQATPFGEVVDAEVARTRELLGERGESGATWPEELPPIIPEREHLRTILAAVLDNAREALGPGGRITLTARAVELEPADCRALLGSAQPGPCLEVTIRDDGCGIAPEVRQRLFLEQFVTTKAKHRGLGLCIVYGLLFGYRGGLRLCDTSGTSGTTVQLVLPFAPAPVPGQSRTTEERPAPAAAGGLRILVVDDDPRVRTVVQRTLERAGYRVQTAGSALEALASYAAARFDPFRLVVSDVAMPQIDGIELARRLLLHDPQLRLLFMSGEVSLEQTQAAWPAQPFELVAKPFHADGLLQAVRNTLHRGS
jgi:CheY-like chemotaxis protein